MLAGNILITGGTGTLGHAIINEAMRWGWPCTFTVYSRSELRQVPMKAKYPHVRMVLGDIRDYTRLSAAVAGHNIVIHAAAMKHVDLCDEQPAEAFSVNCGGSENVVRACIANGVDRCIGISTDKVARAVTAYGATKLVMEKMFMTADQSITKFTLTRYGNVIASNGSVLTVWQRMLDTQGYVTATEPDMTRFWLTPTDAVKLILLAAKQPPSSVVIPRLPSLSMRTLREYFLPDARFEYKGLRTNEKRHEDLLTPEETRLATELTDPLAPYGYYLLLPVPPESPSVEPYNSQYPSHTITKDEFLKMVS